MPELIDIRDKHGQLTGETMFRSDVHKAEAWHGVSIVWVYNSRGEILIQLRQAHLNTFPEKWDVSVSGHLSAGDHPRPTAARELREELGIHVEEGELEEAGMIADSFPLANGKIHKECGYVYMVKQDVSLEELRLQVAEVMEVRWITPEQLRRDLDDEHRKVLYSGRGRKVFDVVLDAARAQQAVSV